MEHRTIGRGPARPFRKVRSLGSRLETGVALLLAQGLVTFVPTRHWRSLLRRKPGYDAAFPAGARERARGLGKQVERIGDAFPWQVKCLPRALAASAMLSRRGIGSHIVIGARRSGETPSMDLHAWLMVGESCVVGRKERETYRAFVPARGAPNGAMDEAGR
ncbi:lasso peptide biosynthesis B2 protein [Alteriqipengyuania lutimaris]|uniref:Lasso peptide biosynthesis B2 protein n=1 Tax=Alteriqipengyuania lutimaris TaxID=1538146 RepID=A0A395LJ74_9SPHN|nr:lasso peptide biosynthesis B2 protein [Alteriqipengyuania lutimaris]MBB3034363.1 hypothetical protein [Alteriqipengyuania lutimaris]RDS76735.1 lasso peptide biosynthesis B2 protein [Alteriqipengyuania lutimaris]